MRTKKYVSVILGIVLLMAVSISVAGAQERPVLPCAFYGSVKINGVDAPIGTVITAEIEGIERGSITTTEVGKYGGAGGLESKLGVIGNADDEGKIVTFYINGVKADQTALWKSGGVYVVDLTMEAGAGVGQTPTVVPILVVAVILAIAVVISAVYLVKRKRK